MLLEKRGILVFNMFNFNKILNHSKQKIKNVESCLSKYLSSIDQLKQMSVRVDYYYGIFNNIKFI